MPVSKVAPVVDLTEFYRLSKPRKKPCTIGHARTLLSKSEVEKLDAALSVDPGIITHGAIETWIKNNKKTEEVPVTVSGVVSHRKGSCSCDERN